MEEQNEKETMWTRIKHFVIRNKKKFIIGGLTVGGLCIGGGLLERHLNGDDDIETVEEDYESVEYIEDSDESNDSEE